MSNDSTAFQSAIQEGYTFKKDYIILGGGMLNAEPVSETLVKVPLKTLNRHGLIAGATGTGKTKSLQVMAEQLSMKGIPSIVMDLKGDLSGLAQPGEMNKHIEWRHGAIGIEYQAEALPVELMTLSDEPGVRLRATVTEFGPVLLSKLLDLNDTQSGVISILFKYADDQKLPLIDLADLKKILQYAVGEGKEAIKEEYGQVASSTVNAIMRKIVELEQQGAEQFFGEPSFAVKDLVRKDENGKGVISIVRLGDIQNKPKLFSTFMLSLLAETYETFPERGDNDVPLLCFFLDEAHLVFDNATKALLDQIEMIIKLIRSKGIGIYFITQNPTDIPDGVLSQLGLKVQHALRAFTAKDRKEIKKTAENFPETDFYQTDELLTELGIGEALVTCLNEKGIPTPLIHSLMRAPKTRMDVLTNKEIRSLVATSELTEKYAEDIDRKSAKEILEKKIEAANKKAEKEEAAPAKSSNKRSKKEKGFLSELSKNTMVRQLGRTVIRELTRGLLGVLKK